MRHSLFRILAIGTFGALTIGATFVSAISIRRDEPVQELTFSGIEYPAGESFKRLKDLIDETFTVQKKKSGYSYSYFGSSGTCISSGWLCPNYKYTSLTEKSIKYIILETYEGNEAFYKKLLETSSYYSSYDYSNETNDNTGAPKLQLAEVLRLVPIGTKLISPITNIFSKQSNYPYYYGNTNLGSNLLSSSFGIDFTENSNQNTMLSALEQKIKDMKRVKCQKQNQSQSYSYDSTKCPWNGEISNKYLPTPEELYAETIYVSGRMVKIESVKDEFEYIYEINEIQPFKDHSEVDRLINRSYEINKETYQTEYEVLVNSSFSSGSFERYTAALESLESELSSIRNLLRDIRSSYNEKYVYDLNKLIGHEATRPNPEPGTKIIRGIFSKDYSIFYNLISEELNYYKEQGSKGEAKYSLRYKTESYTLESAKAELEKKQTESSTVFGSATFTTTRLPCSNGTSYFVRSECIAAQANMNMVMTALGAFYSDKERYPFTLDELNTNYIPKQQLLENFKENFSYKSVSGATRNTNEYEITYIGKIGEGASLTSEKVDYVALLSGATVPKIPDIFLHAPSDSAVLYIKDPQNLFALFETKSNTTTRLSGVDISQSVKQIIQDFFELKDFSTLEKNLQHEALLVIENLDFTAPDITLILSESDRAALSPSAKARVVGSKDGFIYVSNSKSTIDRFMSLTEDKSLSLAPDFRYVWQKKSELIKDAYMFVGDAFFEKMLTLETYITHYRKIRDVERLGKLQELVWSYQDAYGKLPSNFDELLTKMDSDGKLKPFIEAYSIDAGGKVVHRNIGTLWSIKTISEVQYDLSDISRSELEDYKTNVLKYRDIWRASLDPMGIVLNRYGDGLEIDFFMTPIPKLEGDSRNFQEIFEGVTKESFQYLKNEKLRMGLFTIISGFDPKKLEKKALNMKDVSESIEEVNTELLNGKNIFDYIGGEGAFTIGSIPSDILDGWNVEKIDAHIAIEFTSQEKGKEFIDIVRKKYQSEFEDTSNGYLDMKTFFAKPLIEDYEGEQIFYVEAIPVPFVGKIGFAYTFIDNFFFLGLNRTTMKHVIDVAKSGDSAKKSLIDEGTALKNSFFVSLLDGKSASSDLKGLYEKNRTSIPRYAALLDKNDNGLEGLTQTLSSYYVTRMRAKRLGLESKPFEFLLGGLSLSELEDEISVRIDEGLQKDLSGTTLQLWDNISTDERFPKELLSKNGIKVEDFLSNSMKSEILAFELIVQLDRVFEGSESLLRNSTFSVAMGDNEIGFISRVFREKDGKSGGGLENSILGKQWVIYGVGGLGILLILGLGIGFMMYRKRRLASTILSSSIIPVAPGTPSPVIDTVPQGIVFRENEAIISPNASPIVPAQVAPIGTPIEQPLTDFPVSPSEIISEVAPTPNSTPTVAPSAPIPSQETGDTNPPPQS